MDYFAQQLINGLVLGSIYGLIAIGYTMVYGIVGMINFAHGDIFMIGGFIAMISFLVLVSLGLTAIPLILLIVLLVSMVITALYGWTIERIAYRPLRHSFRLAPMLSAIGMSFVLTNFSQVSQGARVKPVPPIITGGYTLHEGSQGFAVQLSNIQIMVVLATIVVLALFTWLVSRTRLGRDMRACEQDQTMAALLGVDVDRTISMTFVIGAALAAVAGMMYLLYYGLVDFFMGFVAGIKAFTAAVLGGIGSLRGLHNAQNAACASACALAMDVASDVLQNGLRSFPGLAHRMEQVGRRGHVLFVNDSKGTNADAAAHALSSFADIYWIAGGKPKAGGITGLSEYFPRIRKAYLIGEAAAEFSGTLGERVPHEMSGTLDVAIASAARDAEASGLAEAVVLLSPACASFDQYRNFEIRGTAFRDIVQALPGVKPVV